MHKLKIILLGIVCLGVCSACTDQSGSQFENSTSQSAQDTEDEIEIASLVDRSDGTASREETYRFVVLGDSHGDEDMYPDLLQQIQAEQPAFVIHVGDLSKVGGLAELQKAKQLLDATGLLYYCVPGDHDFVDSGSVSRFGQIFGTTNSYFDYEGYRFVLFDNSDTGTRIDQSRWDWFEQASNVTDPVFVFVHNPPEHTFVTTHTMQEAPEGTQDAQKLRQLLGGIDVKQIFAGEMHFFSRYKIWDEIPVTVVGAAGQYSNPYLPQYALVLVYNTGEIEVEKKLLTQ